MEASAVVGAFCCGDERDRRKNALSQLCFAHHNLAQHLCGWILQCGRLAERSHSAF